VNTLHRIVDEYVKLLTILSWKDRLQFLSKTLLHAPDCLRQHKLLPVDAAMRGEATIVYRGKQLVIPFGSIDDTLLGDDSPTFGVIREMFANDVYLRAFRTCKARSVIDLGANRGFFMLIARKVMGAAHVIGVEPLPKYAASFDAICNVNHLTSGSFIRSWAMIGSRDTDDTVSMQTLLSQNNITHVDFVKCDIEGGEFAVFLENNDWVSRVQNIAMELHHWAGDVGEIADVLKHKGFDVLLTNQFFLRRTNVPRITCMHLALPT
jgi:hypothetical protein